MCPSENESAECDRTPPARRRETDPGDPTRGGRSTEKWAGEDRGEATSAVPFEDAPKSAYLEYTTDQGERRSLLVGSKPVRIGRDPANDIGFAAPAVSRFHAEVRRTATGWVIRDSESSHGVYVDGVRKREAALEDGLEIRLGPAGSPTLRFRVEKIRGIEETDVDILQSLGSNSRREIRDLATLLDTFLSLSGDLLLEDVLRIVIDRSIELSGADRGLILLVDDPPLLEGSGAFPLGVDGTVAAEVPRVRRLKATLARNREGANLPESELQISQRIPQEVLRTSKGMIIEDLLAPERQEEHIQTVTLGVRSAMCVPLRAPRKAAGGSTNAPELLGVLYVDGTSRNRPFSGRLLSALESLASEAARAISSARLYELSLAKRQMDEEMRIAHTIQANLLPPRDYVTPWVSLHGSSVPCLQVGGDVLGYYGLGEDRLGLVVGDVAGKGIPAAIFSALLQGLSQGLAVNPSSETGLGPFTVGMNRFLLSRTTGGKFVSLFYGLLHSDGDFRYVNAGLPPPIWAGADGRLRRLETCGPILGILAEATYEEKALRLASGDVIVLHSDGISEARSPTGDRYGQARLEAAILRVLAEEREPAGIHRRILGDLETFLAGATPQDDLTLLVLKKL